MYSFNEYASYFFDDNARYYLIVGNDYPMEIERSIDLKIKRWREGATSPESARPRWLTNEEMAQYGYHPVHVQNLTGVLTIGSPTGLIMEDRRYQLFRFSIQDNSYLIFSSPNPEISRRFILYQVDKEAYNAGRPSLVEKVRTFHWNHEFSRYLEAGRYILALEAEYATDTGKIKFQIKKSQRKVSPSRINVRPLTFWEMQDPRFVPKI